MYAVLVVSHLHRALTWIGRVVQLYDRCRGSLNPRLLCNTGTQRFLITVTLYKFMKIKFCVISSATCNSEKHTLSLTINESLYFRYAHGKPLLRTKDHQRRGVLWTHSADKVLGLAFQ